MYLTPVSENFVRSVVMPNIQIASIENRPLQVDVNVRVSARHLRKLMMPSFKRTKFSIRLTKDDLAQKDKAFDTVLAKIDSMVGLSCECLGCLSEQKNEINDHFDLVQSFSFS